MFQAITQRQQRAPESSYVRFGKRAPDGLSYSGCVAYTLARATNRSDLLRMLVQNGCVKDKRLLHYAKKDGYMKKDGYIRYKLHFNVTNFKFTDIYKNRKCT